MFYTLHSFYNIIEKEKFFFRNFSVIKHHRTEWAGHICGLLLCSGMGFHYTLAECFHSNQQLILSLMMKTKLKFYPTIQYCLIFYLSLTNTLILIKISIYSMIHTHAQLLHRKYCTRQYCANPPSSANCIYLYF